MTLYALPIQFPRRAVPSCDLVPYGRRGALETRVLNVMHHDVGNRFEPAEEKKAEDLGILDISKLSSVANYFVITHGNGIGDIM